MRDFEKQYCREKNLMHNISISKTMKYILRRKMPYYDRLGYECISRCILR